MPRPNEIIPFYPVRFLVCYACAQVILAQILSLLYFTLSGVWPTSLAAGAFTFFYYFGHFAFLGLIYFTTSLIFYFFSLKNIFIRLALATYSSFLLTLLVIDAFVYSQYRFHLNSVVLDLFFKGRGQIISFSFVTWLLAFIFLALLLLLNLYLISYLLKNSFRIFESRLFKMGLRLYFATFFVAHAIHAYADSQFNSHVGRMSQAFPLSEPLKAKTFFLKLGLINKEELQKRKSLKKSHNISDFNYPLEKIKRSKDKFKPLNLLFIVVDSLRFDMLREANMPNTFQLSKISSVYTQHYSSSNTTRHGIFGLFYGLPGLYFDYALRAEKPPVIMELLNEENYNFLIYANAPLDKPEFNRTVFSLIPDLRLYSKSEDVYARDIEITQLLKDQLNQKAQQPFFGFLFYDAPHGYSYPKNYKKPFPVESDEFNYLALNQSSNPEPIFNIYKNSVHFVDSLIGEVIELLQKNNLFDNTIILITGDHGQEINDNKLGYWGHNSNYSKYQTQVPMLIYWPGQPAQVYSHKTFHFDIPVTIAENLFFVENESLQYSSGQNINKKNARSPFIMGRENDYAIYDGEQFIVIKPTGDYEVLGNDYRPHDNANFNTEAVEYTLNELSRFLKR